MGERRLCATNDPAAELFEQVQAAAFTAFWTCSLPCDQEKKDTLIAHKKYA
jgi:hypothetical protein